MVMLPPNLVGNLYKPWFATVTGSGIDPSDIKGSEVLMCIHSLKLIVWFIPQQQVTPPLRNQEQFF